MTLEFGVTILTCLVGVGTAILCAAVPWAYTVQGRLTRIETLLEVNKDRK